MTVLISFATLLLGVLGGVIIAHLNDRRLQNNSKTTNESHASTDSDRKEALQLMFDLLLRSSSRYQKNMTGLMTGLFDETSQLAQKSAENLSDIAARVEHSKTQMDELTASMAILGTQSNNGIELSRELNNTLADFRETSEDLNNIEQNIHSITEKATAINGIGQNAEMLALNASIEAARAGEAGRGFAVVADSMKSLAKSSQQMADDIQQVLNKSQNDIADMTQAIQKSSSALLNQADDLVSSYQQVREQIQSADNIASDLNEDFAVSLAMVNKETNSSRTAMESMIREFAVKANEFTGMTIRDLSPTEAKQKLNEFDYLIDVRKPEEYNDDLGHIPGTELITLQTDFPDAVRKLPKDKRYLFICRSGGRSTKAAQQALMQNISDVSNLDGGMIAWREAGF